MSIYNEKILVIGAGVNGSLVATRFQNAGLHITLLARGKRFEEVRDHGVVIENAFSYQRTITRIPVLDRLDPQDRYDFILVVVRKNQVSDLLPVLARNSSSNIVFMVNNPTGPDEWVRILGKDRVLCGFVFGAGKRENGIIYSMSDPSKKRNPLAKLAGGTPFGEVDGAVTPRLLRLVEIFNYTGFAAQISEDINGYLAAHAANVAVMAKFIIDRGYDHESLKRYTRKDFGILMDAMREVPAVLVASGFRAASVENRMLKILPKWVFAMAFQKMLPTRYMEVGALYHISQAPDEIQQLVAELTVMVEKTKLPVPAIRRVLVIPPISG
jgi:2-dehydropantoate 2-reductase